jgi:hypothetical protein
MQWAVEEQVDMAPAFEWAGGKDRESVLTALWAGPGIAVLPVYNLTAAPAPLKDIEQLLSAALAQRGAVMLDKQILEEFMSSRRMRYTGGLDREIASALAEQTGVEAVLVTTLEYFEDGNPPKISLHTRLVSTGPEPEILWMDSVCRAGDDAPGLLDLGVISDSQDLVKRAADELADSLIAHLAGEVQHGSGKDLEEGIGPTVFYREPGMDFNGGLKVAVIPFFNLSERPYAWEIMPLHFVRSMLDSPGFRVLEPGVVRRALLQTRVMVRGGLSGPHLGLILSTTDADLVVSGSVMHYLDSPYAALDPEVEFSVQVYERKSRKVVWTSRSVARGGDGVYFFNKGFRSTACRLGSELSRATIASMTSEAAESVSATNTEGTVP